MTTEQLYREVLIKLKNIYEEREADNITDWIFENVTGLKKWQRRNEAHEINDVQLALLKKYKQELLQHKPVQYVLHEAWFYKLKFYVNEHVLIPRPETEELVSWIVTDIKNSNKQLLTNELKILDIGTGSGCIAILLKRELQNVHITAIDVNENGLSVAKKNAKDLEAQVEFININFLDESKWALLNDYDVIVSNPPYIPQNESKKMPANVTNYEPGIALFVPGNDQFIFYNKIAKFAQSHLSLPGKIYVEIHEDFSKETDKVFIDHNFATEIKEDIYGKKRMIKAMKLT